MGVLKYLGGIALSFIGIAVVIFGIFYFTVAPISGSVGILVMGFLISIFGIVLIIVGQYYARREQEKKVIVKEEEEKKK